MNTENQEKVSGDNMLLSSLETDTIGEILNISMGAAATTISTLLDRKVSITTPMVQCVKTEDFDFEELEPADGVEIEYIKGLHGSNFLIMKRKDVRVIVDLLLGESITGSEEELDELHISALSEIMNQMMGSSSTALADFFGESINISVPKRLNVKSVQEKITKSGYKGYVVTVSFQFEVEGLIDSTFCTIMPLDFTKELIRNAMNLSGNETGSDETNDTQEREEPDSSAPTETREAAGAAIDGDGLGGYGGTEADEGENILTRPGYDRKALQKVNVQPIKLISFDQDGDDGSVQESSENFGLIMDVPLEVTVEVGQTKKLIKEILDLDQGSILEINKQAGDSVDVVVNGRLMARGDVVVVDDNFGVRITEIVSTKDIIGYL